MTFRLIFNAVVQRALALAGASVLIIGLSSAFLPLAWHYMPSAMADPGGNGKDNDGNAKGNGGGAGEHGKRNGKYSEKKDKADDAVDAEEADIVAAAGQVGAPAAVERGGRAFVADEVVVANLGGDAKAAIRRLGFIVLDEQQLGSLGLTITRMRVPRKMTAPAARTLLSSKYPGVLVDLNAIYRPQGQLVLPPPNYPERLIGWGHAPDACGRGLRIGVLDTAVDADSPGLHGAHIVQRSFLPAGAKMASSEHGTAIAAILVGQHSAGGIGLLPGAELAVAGAFGADPDGIPIADVMALVGGLDWLVGSGAPVINMSLAGDANAVVALALRRVIAGHTIIVAAAGNGGPTAPPAFPAAEPGVIAVTAVDSRSQPYADANRGDYIDFAAPGVRIWTPGPTATGSYHTGTSFAAPFVTAAVAARFTDGASADKARIADELAAAAVDLGQSGKDPVFGRGLIQVANPCSALTH